jgi:transposase
MARLTGDPTEVAVGIERPDGRLVDVLLEAGYPVVPVSPNAIKTWSDGEVLSGAKSDAGDAAVIAEYVRLRAHRLQPATPYTDKDTTDRLRRSKAGARHGTLITNDLRDLLPELADLKAVAQQQGGDPTGWDKVGPGVGFSLEPPSELNQSGA